MVASLFFFFQDWNRGDCNRQACSGLYFVSICPGAKATLLRSSVKKLQLGSFFPVLGQLPAESGLSYSLLSPFLLNLVSAIKKTLKAVSAS